MYVLHIELLVAIEILLLLLLISLSSLCLFNHLLSVSVVENQDTKPRTLLSAIKPDPIKVSNNQCIKPEGKESGCDMETPEDEVAGDMSPDQSAEFSNLRCKLESKSKALVILSQDLVEVKRERDEYKLMAEQIRDRYQSLKKRIKNYSPNMILNPESAHHSLVEQFASNSPLAHVLLELTEQNKYLLFEVEELKTKLIDAEGDLKMLREQLRATSNYHSDLIMSPASLSPPFRFRSIDYETENCSYRHQRTMEEVVAQLETFRNRVTLMEQDLQSILDEKEDLIMSRDSYKRKVERLNSKLNELMRRRRQGEEGMSQRPADHHVDIDSLEGENVFLKDKVRQMEEEKKLNSLMTAKYKSMLEQAQSKRTLLSSFGMNYGINSTSMSSGPTVTSIESAMIPTSVISSRQIQQFIASNGLNHLEVSSASITRLRSLVIALFEALSDKSSALALHKKNNKLLGKRITELEDKLRQLNTEKVLMLTKGDDEFATSSSSAAGGLAVDADDFVRNLELDINTIIEVRESETDDNKSTTPLSCATASDECLDQDESDSDNYLK